ncbi:MAG: hypothetical protein R3Y24_05290 [Eubacteriales bacterium]
MYNYGYEEEAMNIRDSVRGIVTGQNKNGGLYIDIQNNEEGYGDDVSIISAFGYWSGVVNRGTEVLCTIKSWAKENKRVAVRVDSVDYGSEVAA